MLYIVSYDLRKAGKDYTGLTEQLQYSQSWCHYLNSTWLIVTSESPSALYNRLAAHLDQGDSILIIEAGNHVQGWLPKEAWEWIQRAIPNLQS